jgi:hypothetical protein
LPAADARAVNRSSCRSSLLVFFTLVLLALAMIPAGASARGDTVFVRALAAGGHPALAVADARVEVVRDGVTVGRGRTGSLGMAHVRTRVPVRGRVTVLVSGGRLRGRAFDGQMAASVSDFRWPRTVHVDTVTTIVSRFAAAHPRLSLATAERRARRFLRLPASYLVGLDGRGKRDFDGRSFLRSARAHRGYDALVSRMVRLMGRGSAHRSFVTRMGVGGGAVASAKGAEAIKGAADIGEAVSAGTGFFEALEKTDYVLDFVDAIVSLSGAGNEATTTAQLQEMSAQLAAVEEGITNLRSELAGIRGQLAEGEYAKAAAQATETLRATETAADTLHSALLLARQGECAGSSPKASECEAARAALEGFVAEYRQVGLTTVTQVNTYATEIAGDATLHGSGLSGGLLQLASALTVGPGQLFYNAEESERLVGIASYWISSYSEALVLAPVYWGLTGMKETVRKEDVERLEPFAEDIQRAMPKTVAQGTVIDIQQGTMWSTQASLANDYTLFSTVVDAGPWSYSGGSWIAEDGSATGAVGTNLPSRLPNADWNVAGKGHLLPLLNGLKPGPSTLGQTLVELSGIERGTILPPYGSGEFVGSGVMAAATVETSARIIEEFQEEEGEEAPRISGYLYWPNSSCHPGPAIRECVWPVWVGNGAEVLNLNIAPAEAGGELQSIYSYRDAMFEPGWVSELRWGVEEESTLYGSDPLNNIPYLMFRAITPSECYFYAPASVPQAGSPGCPG